MNKPKRVQRKRSKGFKLPENTKCVNRGTKWGNPFKVLEEDKSWVVKDSDNNYWGEIYDNKGDAIDKSIECFSGWIDGKVLIKKLDLSELKGKNLACFCPEGSSCHGDVLLKLANPEID